MAIDYQRVQDLVQILDTPIMWPGYKDGNPPHCIMHPTTLRVLLTDYTVEAFAFKKVDYYTEIFKKEGLSIINHLYQPDSPFRVYQEALQQVHAIMLELIENMHRITRAGLAGN